MKSAIILHGKPDRSQCEDPSFPSSSNYYWIPWLQKQFALQGIPANTPEVPEAWRAHYPTWREAFEHYVVTPETMVVGHSCGAGFLVRWLSEHKDVRADKVVLVAPWIDPRRNDSTDFFEFVIDPELANRTRELVIINSDDDGNSIQESIGILRKQIAGIKYVELHGYGHFYDNRRLKFPELAQELFGPGLYV